MPSGIPIHSRSQSSVASSSAEAPAPPVQLPAKALWPVPIRSASTQIGLLGLPMRAKKRGWSARWPRGRIVVEELVDRLLGVARAVGAGRDAARPKSGSIGAIGGCASSCLPAVDEPVPHVVAEAAQLVGRKAQRVHARDNRAMRAAVMRSFEEPLVARGRRPTRRARPTAWSCACSPPASAAATGTRWMGHDPSIALPHVGGHELCGVGGRGGPGGARLVGRRPRDGAVLLRLRGLRAVPARRDAGLRARLPAGVHGLGLVRGATSRCRART